MQNSQVKEGGVNIPLMTKSKRKRLRKQAKLRPPVTDLEVFGKSFTENEEIIVIKTRGFCRNEERDQMEAQKKAFFERMRNSEYHRENYRTSYSTFEDYDIADLDIDTLLEYINGTLSKKKERRAGAAKKQSSKPNKKTTKTSGKKENTFVKKEKNKSETPKKNNTETKENKTPHGKVFAEKQAEGKVLGKNDQEEKPNKKNVYVQEHDFNNKENPPIVKKKKDDSNANNVLNLKSNDQNKNDVNKPNPSNNKFAEKSGNKLQ